MTGVLTKGADSYRVVLGGAAVHLRSLAPTAWRLHKGASSASILSEARFAVSGWHSQK
jgi:hypothetical protein